MFLQFLESFVKKVTKKKLIKNSQIDKLSYDTIKKQIRSLGDVGLRYYF